MNKTVISKNRRFPTSMGLFDFLKRWRMSGTIPLTEKGLNDWIKEYPLTSDECLKKEDEND